MKIDKTIVIQCFQLLQNVFRDAFHIPVLFFTPPYRDFSEIDQGIRASIWPDYFDGESGLRLSDPEKPLRILVIKSNLGFYNILVAFDAAATPDFITIGPFRKEELSSSYYIKILKEAQVLPSSIQGIKYIYQQMPVASPDMIVKITKDMLEAFIPGFSTVIPENLSFSGQKREISVDHQLLEEKLLTSSERFTHLLLALLERIRKGQIEKMEDALQTFLAETKLTDHRSFHEGKMLLHTLNSYCQLTLLESSVHPSYALKAFLITAMEIDGTSTSSDLNDAPLSICRRYCQLAQDFGNQPYTQLTKKVISHIHLHMEDDLSLQQLADHFKKNPSVLSAAFHKDTGETLTRFIHKTRIQEAVRLVHHSDLSISDIALAVGYQDFSYFSKIFSREIGCCPREYRKKI